jgi:hypothetical protein
MGFYKYFFNYQTHGLAINPSPGGHMDRYHIRI